MAREFSRKFYNSKEWIRIRDLAFSRDNGLCQKCLKEKGELIPGDEVHHKIWLRPTNINNPNITLNIDNLVTLCRDCHMSIHKKSRKEKRKNIVMNGMYIDEKGQLRKQKIVVVHGAPGSGKTTYVKEHMEKGDLVVDFDLIKQSISMCDKTEIPDTLLGVAESIRETIYKLIEDKKVDAKTIWIIASLPTRKQRSDMKSRFNADEMIHIDTNIEECIEHILNDEERKDKEKQMILIDKYFGYYQPPH